MKLSSRFRLILIISVILIAAFLFVSFFNYNAAKSSIEGEIVSSSLPLLRENIYSEIKQDFIPAHNISSMMANDSFLKNWAINGEKDPKKVVQYLREIRKEYGYFSVFFISEQTKNYYHYGGILKQINPEDDHDVWYYNFVDSGKSYELDVDNDEASMNRLTIFINFRLEDYTGRLLGVTGVGIEMEGFSEFLEKKQKKYNRRIFFVDKEGMVQAHSKRTLIEQVSIYEKPGINKIAGKILREESKPVDAVYESGDGNVLVTSRYIQEMDWFLIVEQDEDAILVSAKRNLLRTLLIGFFASVIIITLTAVTINYFHKRLEQMAVTDKLTGTANRRELEKQFERAVARHIRHNVSLSVMIIDIDRFKEINDTEGHLEGDRILTGLAETVRENIRPDDLFARWGGDEFVLLLESEGEEAAAMAERLRKALREKQFPVSLSIGIAPYAEGDTLDDAVKKADKALYTSKEQGRDRVTLYTES